ncbi:hypothetical protein TcasGA2_TC012359 [Tribolium castaneum]|uniref:Uncharacterized protein n=1 Tax=Tribolium castaneum TaxID=7070 RepID=D6X1V3_TRICA|nr:hypothetical protein TcasGA2_TC012359 [Tribolium castaneum]
MDSFVCEQARERGRPARQKTRNTKRCKLIIGMKPDLKPVIYNYHTYLRIPNEIVAMNREIDGVVQFNLLARITPVRISMLLCHVKH